MYQIRCDNNILYDPRDDELIVSTPKCNLEANTVGEASFFIYEEHPHYSDLQKLRSIFEIRQGNQVIFRGRMTEDSKDFDDTKFIDLEGVMAFFNDSVVRPFKFPEDFLEDEDYIAAAESGNVVQFFLQWFIDNHNEQVEPFQQFKIGKVTVSDPNNYITRSSTDYSSSWEALESKLFKSELGGYLCIRYENDGNYIDYLEDFELTNTQPIKYSENLLDLTSESDATATYSAILPLGAKAEGEEKRLTIEGLEDGNITDDIVKEGDIIYSKKAVDDYGFILAPTKDTTWDDVTEAENLKTKGFAWLVETATRIKDTLTITAVDLHYSDAEIASFRVCRFVNMESLPHNRTGQYRLTRLEIDILNPQNTKITVGDTVLSFTDANFNKNQSTDMKIETIKNEIINEISRETDDIKNIITEKESSIISSCEGIILTALESYVETGNYEEFKETVEAQLEVLAGDILMKFTTTTEQIENVNGDLQSKFEKLYKYIKYSGETAISISSSDSVVTLELDNEKGIIFKRNGVPFGLWDGENFYTGNIVVRLNERAQFGNFAFVPRSDGSLSFLKVGG